MPNRYLRTLLLCSVAGTMLALGASSCWAGPLRGERAKARPALASRAADDPHDDILPVGLGRGTSAGAREASAADTDTRISVGPPKVSMLDIGGKLCAMVLCIIGLLSGLRLFRNHGAAWLRMPREPRPPSQLRLVESLPLGGNRFIYVIEAGGRSILIGADTTGLAPLGDLATAAEASKPPASAGASLMLPEGATNPGPACDTSSFAPQAPVRPGSVVGMRGQARESRDEASWTRKRDMLIRALQERVAS